MLTMIISLSLALTMPTQVKTVPVTIYATESITETEEEITVETETGNLYAFYSGADEWHKGEKADVTMVTDKLVNIIKR